MKDDEKYINIKLTKGELKFIHFCISTMDLISVVGEKEAENDGIDLSKLKKYIYKHFPEDKQKICEIKQFPEKEVSV